MRGLTIFLVFSLSSAANLLGIPVPLRSHLHVLMTLADQLYSDYGHRMIMIVPESVLNRTFVTESKVEYILPMNYKKLNFVELERNITMSAFEDKYDRKRVLFPAMRSMCEYLLTDFDLINRLKIYKFDMAIVDNFYNSPCLSVLPYKLSIPYIYFGRIVDVIGLKLPLSLSVTPISLSYEYSNPMTFKDRLVNVLLYHLLDVLPSGVTLENAVELYAPEKPHLTTDNMKTRAELELIDYDIVMDWPLPSLPNTIFIGGLTTKPAKTLKEPLANLMDKATNGVVLVSFGSLSSSLPDDIVTMLYDTLKTLNTLTFVIKGSNLVFHEDNVYTTPWLPQNDILGHRNCKVFVTHCGNGGQFESLYHGVPMVGIPLFGDQHYNAKRMTMKGYGLHLNIKHITSTALVNAIKEVMNNPIYKTNIVKASNIYRNRPQTPAQRAAFWVDHIIKFGGDYLRVYPSDQPYFEYRLFDVYAFILVTVAVICQIVYSITKKILKVIKPNKEKLQ